MQETPEERILRERLETHLRPLRKELERLDNRLIELEDEHTKESEALIKQILKNTDLFTRLKVFLEMEHILASVPPNTAPELKEEKWKEAHQKALEETAYIIQTIQQWQKDGAPLLPPQKKDLENEEK